jgi:glycosyltransferase involved in cell wall biosynthesis
MKKVLVIGDGGCFTGFARVLHSVIEHFPDKENYEFHHLAVNHFGDPFQVKNPRHYLYPAALGGDVYGLSRTGNLVQRIDPDIIFILNDLWGLEQYLDRIDDNYKSKVVVYFPIDGLGSDPQWVKDFGKLGAVVSYTEFGKREILNLNPNLNVDIIYHGVDTEVFHPMDKFVSRKTLKGFGENDFVVFNGNRNQPRKRIDLTFEVFSKFAQGKPDNVKLYLHMGVVDSGWHLEKMAKRYGIEKRLVITSRSLSPQHGVPSDVLNLIYNSADVGINTSMGEGWGLVSMEQAVVGVPQVVPDSSACAELFRDCGLLIGINHFDTYPNTLTVGSVIDTDHAANILDNMYEHRDLLTEFGARGMDKFMSKEYSWKYIAEQWYNLFEKVIEKNADNLASTSS